MCGIFGIMWHRADDVPDEYRLKETVKLLHHRGPDGYGYHADVGIGLVHTRLALLDLNPRSDQPLWDKQQRYCLLYNGEIYNFKELRFKLEQRGVEFRTTSDTEVLLEWLINCGVEATLPVLEGMFAFALYDTLENTLVLARDRFGIKPMFIYDANDVFVFASEIQAMRPWLEFEPDHWTISSFLLGFDGPTQGYTFYKNVKILNPGAVVEIRRGETAQYSTFFSMGGFWDPEQAEQVRQIKSHQMIDEIERLLLESVRLQLVADAPVGALCSGGVDSSLILAMAAKYHNNLAIFHANVVGPLSEFEAAFQLAKHLKLDLKAVEVNDQDFIDWMPELIEHYGHPFYHTPHSVPFMMVAQLVRKHNVKAVLTGEGSDECFLGYDFSSPDVRRWRHHPKSTLKELIDTLVRPREIKRPRRMRTPEMVMNLHNRFEVALDEEEIRAHIRTRLGPATDGRNLRSLDLLNYNLRALLHRNDVMGMAASIESRFPFLDSTLVKLAVNMPFYYKIRPSLKALDPRHFFFRDKYILREVADRYLPRGLSQRSKQAFPVNAYQRMQIPAAFFERSFVADLFGISSREVRYLIDNARQDLKLKLLHLEIWGDVFLEEVPQQSIVSKLREHITVKPLS
jgi:asparagine synthase (glutamine-hydrolysing)